MRTCFVDDRDMVEDEIPHLSITVDDKDINAGALDVLQEIRPLWRKEDVELKVRLFVFAATSSLVVVEE